MIIYAHLTLIILANYCQVFCHSLASCKSSASSGFQCLNFGLFFHKFGIGGISSRIQDRALKSGTVLNVPGLCPIPLQLFIHYFVHCSCFCALQLFIHYFVQWYFMCVIFIAGFETHKWMLTVSVTILFATLCLFLCMYYFKKGTWHPIRECEVMTTVCKASQSAVLFRLVVHEHWRWTTHESC